MIDKLCDMPFVAAKATPKDPNPLPPPPLVGLTYFNVSEAQAKWDDLGPDEKRDNKKPSVPLWQLTVPFGYVRAKDDKYYDVPVHSGNVAIYKNHTDLATIPGFLWGILAPYGRQLRPALLHDRRCDIAKEQNSVEIRKDADNLFRVALFDEGVKLLRRWIFWAGVSFGRFLGYQKARGIPLAAAVVVSVVVSLHAAALGVDMSVAAANRWLFSCPFWITVGALFVATYAITLKPLVAAVVPAIAAAVALLSAGTRQGDTGWLHSWKAHVIAACVALAAVLITGLLTDLRVALIGVLVSPLIVLVVFLTLTVAVLLALPDLRKGKGKDKNGGGLGPILPTVMWRLK